ncbi:S-fimbrial adhesin minor pilin SfaH, partial [Escherichia coli]|nr:fimbrial protein [Escherichia coli]EFN8826222.1 fimbrial protein [Escherichia coli]EFO0961306.1 fimbrial protein [Escherichia coli]EHR8977984.1 S-fimbrial adhesin minor pilin SfaH [Escherichia coli]EHT1757453.1 S-fimbrial adhesin minor pilin SfaH [Escherichia coli]
MRKYYPLFKKSTALRGCILFTLIMAYSQPSFALLCRNNQTGQVFNSGDTSFRVNVSPVVQYDKSISVLDLSQLVSCQNEDSTGQNYDYLKILKGSGFSPSLDTKTYGRLDFTSRPTGYARQLPLQFDLQVTEAFYQYGVWKPFPAKLYLYPEPGVFGKVINNGDLLATLYVNKFSTKGQEAGERNFTWRFYATNDVYIQTGTCRVSSNNVKVDLPSYPGGPVTVPLTVRCDQTQSVSYTLSGSVTGSGNTVFANTATSGAGGVGVQLSDNAGPVPAGQPRSLGQVG